MITLALIGVGKWGINYIHTANSIKGCRIKYIYSPHIRSKKIDTSTKQVSKLQQLFIYKDIDGFIVASPGYTHYAIVKELIKRHYPVLVEKPFVTSYKDARYLKKQFQSGILLIGYQYLYHSAIQKIKKSKPRLGNITYIEFEARKPNEQHSDSALWEWGSHDISILIDLLDSMPQYVSARAITKKTSKTPDFIVMNLYFAKNLHVLVKCGWLSAVKKRTISIIGEKASIFFDDLSDKKITYYDYAQDRVYYPEYNSTYPLTIQMNTFITAIRNSQNISNIDLGMKVSKVLFYAEKSIAQGGKRIKLS